MFCMSGVRAGAIALAVATGLTAAGCQSERRVIEPDRYFSINVARVASWYPPSEESLTQAQIDVLVEHGRPVLFRFWWTPTGEFINGDDVHKRFRQGTYDPDRNEELKKIMLGQRASWVFIKDNSRTIHPEELEVIFSGDGVTWEERPLSQRLKLICIYGDPTDKSPIKMIGGLEREVWRWDDYGYAVTMLDGRITDVVSFPGFGPGTRVKY